MSGPARRRFIAGAVCPGCGQVDKIFVDSDKDQRQCVSCGFSEYRPQGSAGKSEDISTRVSRPAARRVETPPEAIILVDPGEK